MKLFNFDFLKSWETIEIVKLKSPHNNDPDDYLEMAIQHRNNTFKKIVTHQVFEETATEEDKLYYLTQYLLVVEYLDAVNAGRIKMPCREFLQIANNIQKLQDFDDTIVETSDAGKPSI